METKTWAELFSPSDVLQEERITNQPGNMQSDLYVELIFLWLEK